MSLLPAPSSAQNLLGQRRRGRRLELIYQQTLSAPVEVRRLRRVGTVEEIKSKPADEAVKEFLRELSG